jgi:hypothetical protein
MAKKSVHKKAKYQQLRLHGNYPKEKVLTYSAVALGAGLIAGYFLQPYIVSVVMSFYH